MAAASPANSGKGRRPGEGGLEWLRTVQPAAGRGAGNGLDGRICDVCDEFWSLINGAGIRVSGIYPPVTTIESAGVGADSRR
uniref:Uncharacterized protein n=1 Tax=Oryza barthii TaxID=65489 RepID=A0A0D3FUJ9_9ORYZ